MITSQKGQMGRDDRWRPHGGKQSSNQEARTSLPTVTLSRILLRSVSESSAPHCWLVSNAFKEGGERKARQKCRVQPMGVKMKPRKKRW
jgi:hypothetical protein